jgi:hypothetical protein
VARYLRRQAPPHESVFVLVSRPNVYHLARRRPPTRYLWHPPLARIPGAMRALRRRLSGPRRPAYVVVYQPPARADPSGALGRLVAAHYVRDPDAPPGLPPILRRRD